MERQPRRQRQQNIDDGESPLYALCRRHDPDDHVAGNEVVWGKLLRSNEAWYIYDVDDDRNCTVLRHSYRIIIEPGHLDDLEDMIREDHRQVTIDTTFQPLSLDILLDRLRSIYASPGIKNGFFSVGSIVTTPASQHRLAAYGTCLNHLLVRHAAADWGDVRLWEWEINSDSLNGLRSTDILLSRYRCNGNHTLVVVSIPDDDITYVLTPEEYRVFAHKGDGCGDAGAYHCLAH